MSLNILILDDETIVGERLKASLEKDGHSLEAHTSPHEAIKSLNENLFDIVVTDIRMDDIDGIKILEMVKNKSPQTKVIMITGYATLEVARESLTKERSTSSPSRSRSRRSGAPSKRRPRPCKPRMEVDRSC